MMGVFGPFSTSAEGSFDNSVVAVMVIVLTSSAYRKPSNKPLISEETYDRA